MAAGDHRPARHYVQTSECQCSVVNVARILTLDKGLLTEKVSKLPDRIMEAIDDGLRLVIRQ